MRQYKSILKGKRGSVIGVIVLHILSSFGMVFAGYSLSYLYTAYEYERNKTKALLCTFAIILLIWVVAMGVSCLSKLAEAQIKMTLKNRLRSMVGRKIAALNYTEYTSKDCGNYISWLTNDVDQIYTQFFSTLFNGVEFFSTAIFSLCALCLLSPYIGLTAIILLIVISVLPQLASSQLQKINEERSIAMEASVESYKDVIMGGTIFYLSNLRERICERIVGASQKSEQADYQFSQVNILIQTAISAISLVGQIILVLVALLTAAIGSAPAGAALAVGNLAGSFFNGASAFVKAYITIRSSKPLWKKFQTDGADTSEVQANIPMIPAIQLEDVSFRYGDNLILENKNYRFKAGGKYAIMGESGSGKTTLIKIILGILPNYTGNVLYGNLEQRKVNLESLYSHVAYMDQQVYLFQDTVRFNITLGKNYTDEEIMAVIKKCCLEDYVKSLPNGLDTIIKENGKNLSGGQRQRIALARGLIRNVQYVIIDEGTSALDEANAIDIEMNLVKDPRLGVIIITHNLRDSIRSKLTDVYYL